MSKIDKMKELVAELNNASAAYYNGIESELSDQEFDLKLEELKNLEIETGIIMSNSLVNKVGYQVINGQNKITHTVPMLSLEKVHSAKEIIDFAKEHSLIAMFKMDGISLRATYDKIGNLIGLETRGNGVEGSDLFYQRYSFENIPLHIDVNTETIIDGEAIITDKDFKSINDSLSDKDKYSHSRNLAAGSLALLDTGISAKRHLKMIVWDVIKGGGDFEDSFSKKLNWAEEKGFDIVDYVVPMYPITEKDIDKINEQLMNDAKEIGYGIDGVVWKFESVHHGNKMGRTEHHFCNAVAWKPKMKAQETILRDIVFDTSRTGMICPVAVFDEIDLDGALTTRATLHNLSYIKDLELGIGDTIQVIRSNMVIPKVIGNLTRSNTFIPPSVCPICGEPTEIVTENTSSVLMCTNENCKGKLLGKLELFVSKEGMNIDGLSTAQLQVFISKGWLNNISDIYGLKNYGYEMKMLDGFGEKSVDKLLDNIEKSSECDSLANFIRSLGIPLCGKTQSKIIAKKCNDDIVRFMDLIYNHFNFSSIEGIGDKRNKAIYDWFDNEDNMDMVVKGLFGNIIFIKKVKENSSEVVDNSSLNGKTFVVTGSVEHFKNRNELATKIEELGGNVSGSVSAKTNYLINNDINSTSGKNAKAKSLGVPIISEEDFIKMIGEY